MDIINEQYKIFEKSHKNKINQIIHVVCSLFFVSFLNVFIFKGRFLFLYLLILLFTSDIFESLIGIFIVYILSFCILKLKLNATQLIIGILLFYFIIPEVSHLITNEESLLGEFNILDSFINFTHLLPFSLSVINNEKHTTPN